MRLLLPLILALFLLPACGDKASSSGGGGSAPDGAESAEALFKTLNELAANDDHAGAVPYIVPDQRGMMTFFMGVFAPTMMLSFGEAFAQPGSPQMAKIEEQKKSFAAMLEKHGLESDPEKLMEPLKSDEARENPEVGFAVLGEMFKDVDHAALIRDGLAWMEKNSDKEDGKKDSAPTLKKLLNLKVDGDKATADIEGKDVGVEFVKIDGRWYVDFSEMIKKGK